MSGNLFDSIVFRYFTNPDSVSYKNKLAEKKDTKSSEGTKEDKMEDFKVEPGTAA